MLFLCSCFSWSLKLHAHHAFQQGDLVTAYHMLLRYQMMRQDFSSLPTVRRMFGSFVGRAQRVLYDGGHLVALLRALGRSKELKVKLCNFERYFQLKILSL